MPLNHTGRVFVIHGDYIRSPEVRMDYPEANPFLDDGRILSAALDGPRMEVTLELRGDGAADFFAQMQGEASAFAPPENPDQLAAALEELERARESITRLSTENRVLTEELADTEGELEVVRAELEEATIRPRLKHISGLAKGGFFSPPAPPAGPITLISSQPHSDQMDAMIRSILATKALTNQKQSIIGDLTT